MLKRLFTSNARIKLLTMFLLNPDAEYFIRELTRKLDEQINSVRRELTNLKKVGLLKSKMKNRKKYYVVNKNFVLFNELRNIFIKSSNNAQEIIKKILKLGRIDLLVLSGVFVDRKSPTDLLVVGKLDGDVLQQLLDTEVRTHRPITFSILDKQDFVYRWNMHDKFVKEVVSDPNNIVGFNKLGPLTEEK
ncbi:MAG: polymerase subunit beta protein [Candidatus Peregrinibacteria bacterium GW2011_GWA2_47_7]|nr:MAG: polymerase subunit beta protein [Candidatus Peregrinibacteria bacterium GW2011_GWA2_47_7]